MKKIIFSIAPLILLSGCAIKSSGPYSDNGWNTLNPPQSDALGASIIEFNGNSHLGDHVKRIKPSQIEYRDSAESYSQKEISNFKAGIDAAIKGVSADLNYTTDSSSSKIANTLRVAKIKNATMVNEENKWFVYQCLVAGSYEFSAKKASSSKIGVDAAKSEWAKALGMDKASLEVSSNPASPDELIIKVNNPNVCLSYIAAKFEPDDPFFSFMRPSINNITRMNAEGKHLPTFTLRTGEESSERTADIEEQAQSSKTLYRLKVTKAESGTLQLRVCKTTRGIPNYNENEEIIQSKDNCEQILPESSTGHWRGPQPLDIETPSNNNLVLVTLNLDARTVSEDSIYIKEPRINVSRFKIRYK